MFKTNLNSAKNDLTIIKQARSCLWENIKHFKIKYQYLLIDQIQSHKFSINNYNSRNITLDKSKLKHIYMDNENLNHRRIIFSNFETFLGPNSLIDSFQKADTNRLELNCLNLNSKVVQNQKDQVSNTFFINNIFDDSRLIIENNVFLLNCFIKNSILQVGKNTILNDIFLVVKINLLIIVIKIFI